MLSDDGIIEQKFSEFRNIFDRILQGQDPVVLCLGELSTLPCNISADDKMQLFQVVRSHIMVSCKELSERHSASPKKCGFIREIESRILCILECKKILLSDNVVESSPDLSLSDWIAELVERLGLCYSEKYEWKQFLRREVTERYADQFGRTLYHVYLNLGIEPPTCLPKDELDMTGTPRISDNGDEVDGALPESQRLSPQSGLSDMEQSSTQSSTIPSRVALRQSLPRALFGDPAIVAATGALCHKQQLEQHDKKSGQSNKNQLSCSTTPATSRGPEPQLVLIACPRRSRRKCNTPTKRLQVKRVPRRASKANTPSTVEQSCSSGSASKRNPSGESKRIAHETAGSGSRTRTHLSGADTSTHSDHKDTTTAPTSAINTPKHKTSKRRYRRSVHETPNPEKSYPRWERAKLAAAEKTKGKAVIVEESPIKPAFCLGSPIRRLRRANSIRTSSCYFDPTHVSNSQPDACMTADRGGEPPAPLLQLLPPADGCLSRTMSRAEQWRRRQFEEELSLSQYATESTQPDTERQSVVVPDFDRPVSTTGFLSLPNDLRRRNSNLFANMISPERRPGLQSPPRTLSEVQPVNSVACRLAVTSPPDPLPQCVQPFGSSPLKVSSSRTPHMRSPELHRLRSPLITPLGRTRLRVRGPATTNTTHSPVSNSRPVPISPQIFDEEAMFLGREEFLNVTNTTPSVGGYTSPPDSLVRTTSDLIDDGLEAEAVLTSLRKRRRRSSATPTATPVHCSTNQLASSPCGLVAEAAFRPDRSSKCSWNKSVISPTAPSKRGFHTHPDSSPGLLGLINPPARSPFAPLHIFNRPIPTEVNGTIQYSDLVDNATLSSQSASAVVALRSRLFGNQDSNESKQSDSQNPIQISTENHDPVEPVTKRKVNSIGATTRGEAEQHSRHLWDDSSLDLRLSPGLRKLRRSAPRGGPDEQPAMVVKSSYLRLSDLNDKPTCVRPRRSLFQ